MYIYNAYNICIHSEIQLPELLPSEGKADVTVRLGKNLNSISKETIDRNRRVIGEIPNVALFLAEDGRQITIEPCNGISEAILAPNIVGSIMAIVLAQRGLLVLHASSVAINNRVVAFMGGSGWGKSTLAAAFHAQGYDILTEDVMAVEVGANNSFVIPSFPQFKLWPEAANYLGQDSTELPPVFPNGIKLACRFNSGFCQTPLPLHRIYILAKGTNHQITNIKSHQAFLGLVQHSFSTNVMQSRQFLSLHTQQCSSLAKNLSFRRFTRKPSLLELPELVKLVEQDLATNNSDNSSLTLPSVSSPSLW